MSATSKQLREAVARSRALQAEIVRAQARRVEYEQSAERRLAGALDENTHLRAVNRKHYDRVLKLQAEVGTVRGENRSLRQSIQRTARRIRRVKDDNKILRKTIERYEQENNVESVPTAQHTDVCPDCGGARDYAGQSGWICRTEGCSHAWARKPENSSQSEDSKVDVCGDSMETAGIEPAKGNAQSECCGGVNCDCTDGPGDAPPIREEIERLPVEWMERNHPNYAIYDPDGWRVDGKSMFDPITEVEFERRYASCTVGPNTWVPTAYAPIASAPIAGASAADPLTFRTLRVQNVSRKIRWHGFADDWSGADWSNAMAGECGEACNIVKKLRRHETRTGTSYNTPDAEELLPALADELADVVTYCDLLAYKYGIDLGAAVRAKFNRVSAAQDFPERL